MSSVFVSKSSVIRFMEVFFVQMLDTARLNWKRFEEYFSVLKDFAQLSFAGAKYLIENGAIEKLLEFTMNCSEPYYSSIKVKMGDRMQDPNFTIVVDILAILIRSCMTQGVTNV